MERKITRQIVSRFTPGKASKENLLKQGLKNSTMYDLNKKPARIERERVESEQIVATDAVQPKILTIDSLGSNGRLGNQMFQVASTIGLAHKHGLEAVFPPWYCNYTKKHISQFFANPVKQVSTVQMRPIHNYQEVGFTYHDVTVRPNMRIKGYFQSEKYFENIADLVRHHFKPAQHVINKIVGKYGNQLDGNTCAVHIRRGDYINNSVHDTCDMNYYMRGIKYVNDKVGVDRFFIFSDDINWCRQNLQGNYVFVDGNIDIEDLFIMSMCKHFVISNSSFSWWASWLCAYNDKLIVAPTKWFTDASNIDQIDIYTKKMIRL